ncbi:3-ketodihydrosphingosine reductase TSC10 [Phytophthora ramorum]|uniref:3-ketodihydrosphingosine reductase TSC10 n=1 Tax=Phytophthora ramorum TaxID=164328 RepID=UPI0030B3D421|nr:3-ketodihydrosphingosine reductase TSC10 [Phytophthora ramorum]
MALGWIAPIVLVGLCVLSWFWSLLTAPRFNVRGLHVMLTGAENPLGLAIAKKYIKKGAKVSLIGPSMEALKAVQSDLQKVAGEEATVFVFECELVDVEHVDQAVAEANAFHGRPTDHIVYAASRRIKPGYFWEQDLPLMKEAMDVNYYGAVVLVKVIGCNRCAAAMIEAKVRGRIVFVSSVDSLEFPVGCGACSGTKSAIRGLADSLRNELLLYNISVAVFYPGTSSFNLLDTATGFKSVSSSNQGSEETSTPPGVNEGHITTGYSTFEDQSLATTKASDKRAQILINGLWFGQYSITTTWNGFLLRMLANGVEPRNNTFLEWIFIFFVGGYHYLRQKVKEASIKAPARAGTAAHV